MLLAHLSGGMPSSSSTYGPWARAYQTIRARRFLAAKDVGSAIGLLILAAIIFLCDPALQHCNRWAHQASCGAHSTHR